MKMHGIFQSWASKESRATARFIHQIHDLLGRREHLRTLYKERQDHQARGSQRRGCERIEPNDTDYTFLVRDKADPSIETSWSTIYPFVPIVHWLYFEKQYDALREVGSTSSLPTNLFLCILNPFFAVSAELSSAPDTETRKVASESYCARARHLSRYNVLEKETIESLQALMLMAQYLQSTNNLSRSWKIIEIAIHTVTDSAFTEKAL